jgi:ABC-type uncharacterized transport system substrate-binding protein
LFEALRALGYEDGRTTAIELLGGEGDPDRLNTLVAKLISQSPDVIIALTEPAVAKRTCQQSPGRADAT